jgi:hypothetical protein
VSGVTAGPDHEIWNQVNHVTFWGVDPSLQSRLNPGADPDTQQLERVEHRLAVYLV